ncbi:hypothetical protein LMG24238_01424 [Paraburkholderia sediminicola]|uniref:Methyl-accepting transducer domain-containing protein n=1 Tax=Paraburkholderia sediminicola TaxID=458836 RepID=A0A6J5A6T4_9BURK|nr:methyl-accepting chemotaxis protein [Paraburkholderia sediminicola]CAB3656236.1 hypothetical protein LMG24238_01424 [Paraburkholderia sediminicola]
MADSRRQTAAGVEVTKCVCRPCPAQCNAFEGTAKRIGDIIGVIDGIAFRINILTLNATVETARAGEAGGSFAVVAGCWRDAARGFEHEAHELEPEDLTLI